MASLTLVASSILGVGGSARADTVIAMPPPPKKDAAPASATAAVPASSSATASATAVDPGVLALRRYAGARSRPFDTYRSSPYGDRDNGEVWSTWSPWYRGPFIGYGFYRYGWPWSITIECQEPEG